ncbi:serine protease [Daedaleopsis nitida]|nr:serine protease [Daedaleopsis nitida]
MQLLVAFIAVIALLPGSPTLAAPGSAQLNPILKYAGQINPGSYIVKLKSDVSKEDHLNGLRARFGPSALAPSCTLLSGILNGYSGKLLPQVLDALRVSDDVEYIQEDGIVHTSAIETNAPWGLQRINQRERLQDGSSSTALTYTYNPLSTGSGVDVYVVDTGINIAHNEFNDGRAKWGKNFAIPIGILDPKIDDNGHGTHCAGTIAGKRFGVAKNTTVIAVKVLNALGSGSTSSVVCGIDYAAQQAQLSGRPSVISMSLGGSNATALDDAVSAVAAGNDGADAINTSPAHVPEAITVCASDITDTFASFSNFGSVVDTCAPGVDVTSAWIPGTDSMNTISGTSMATPHVAGVVAQTLETNPSMTPPDMAAMIRNTASKGKLTSVPIGTNNNLVYNGP